MHDPAFNPDRDYPALARKQAERISELEEENKKLRQHLSHAVKIELLSAVGNGLEGKSANDLIAMTIAEFYLTHAGIADDGEADRAAERVMAVLDELGYQIVRKSELTSLRRERDDALRVADIVRDLATPPISDADVEAAVAEARRVS